MALDKAISQESHRFKVWFEGYEFPLIVDGAKDRNFVEDFADRYKKLWGIEAPVVRIE